MNTIVAIAELTLSLVSGSLGILLLLGKIRIEIVRRPKVEEPEEEPVTNYVKPMETLKPPMLVEKSEVLKRKRGRPRKTVVLPVPPAL